MPSASKSTNLYSNNGGAYPLGVSFDEIQTSTSNNTSTLSLNGYLQAVGEYWSTGYASTLALGWHDNRRNEDVNVASISFSGMAERETKTISGSITVTHKEDGTLSGYAYITFTKGQTTSIYAPNSGSVATDLTALTNIARYPLITSAPNFNDEESPTIQFTTSLGFEGATVEAGIKTDLNASPIIAYRQVTVADGSYTFNLTNAERNTLRSATPNSNSLTIYFVLKTTTDNQEFFSTLQKTVSIVNANPTIENVTFTETNSKLVSILGSSANILVKNASILSFSIPFTTYKYATPSVINVREGIETSVIQSYSHPNPTSPDTFTNIQVTGTTNSGKFIFKITDSRGNVGTKVDASRTIVDYKQVSIANFSLERQNPTSANIILNLEANYYQQTFGSTPNVPVVKWKLDDGTYNTIPSSNYTIDTTNNKLTISNYMMTDALVYTSNGTFTLTIEDLLTSASDTQDVLKGVPTYDEGERDLQVNGDLFIADTDGENAVNVLETINGLKGEILWTNPDLSSTTAYFNQQDMNLSSSDYDMLEIIYYDYVVNKRYASVRVHKGSPININSLFDYNSKTYMGVRTIYYTNASKLWANDCYACITASAIDTSMRVSNQWCVPAYVIGYKTGLF